VVVPALSPTSVAFTDVWPAVIVTDDVLQWANAVAVRFTTRSVPLGRLSRIGIGALEPRPTDTVSRPNEMMAGTAPPTVTSKPFDVMEALVAVMRVVSLATPVTTPVVALTVATAGFADAKPNEPPGMYRLFASLPRAVRARVPLIAMVAVGLLAGGVSSMDASTCWTVSEAPGFDVKPWAVARTCV
jgi:hypothetical protein